MTQEHENGENYQMRMTDGSKKNGPIAQVFVEMDNYFNYSRHTWAELVKKVTELESKLAELGATEEQIIRFRNEHPYAVLNEVMKMKK